MCALKTAIFYHYLTSTVGLVMVICGIYTGLTGKTTWTESNFAISAGIGFLLSKDFNKKETI